MGLFGGTAKQGPTDQAQASNFLGMAALQPHLAFTPGFGNPAATFLRDNQPQFGSYLQGIPGVLTFDSFGNPQPVGSDNLPSLLPKFGEVSKFDTLFEKADAGSLGPTAQGLLDSFVGMVGGGGAGGGISSILGGISGGGISAGSLPEIEDPVFNAPDNIGALTSSILADMPPEFQEFTQRVLDSSDPASFEAELQNFEDKMTTKMFADLDAAGESLMDVFASEGLGVAGAAMAASKELAIRGVIETNAVIASERMKSLQIYTDRLKIGNEITNILLSAGAQEQANLVAGEVARMNAKAGQEIAALNGAVALQTAAMQAQVQQQSILAGAAVDLFGIQAGLASQAFAGLLGESNQEEGARQNALALPFNMAQGLGQVNKSTTPTGGLDIGAILGGVGALAGGAIAASDRRVKRNIQQVGYTSKGYPLYTFNYLWDDIVHVNVMAQDVEKVQPDAVIEINGIKHIVMAKVYGS